MKKRIEICDGVVFETGSKPGTIDIAIGSERRTVDQGSFAEAFATVGLPRPMPPLGMMPPAFPPFGFPPPMHQPPVTKSIAELPLTHAVKEEHVFAPGESKVIQTQPQMIFRGSKIVVDDPEIDVKAFLVEDLKVGCDSCLLAPEGVPLAALLNNEIPMDAAAPGILISIRLKNITDKPQKFRGRISGVSLQ